MKPIPSRVPARMRAVLAVALAAPLLVAASRPPHLELAKSAPADGSTVHAVSEIRLWFNEAPMDMGPSSVSIRILGADEKVIATGSALRDAKDAKVYALALPRGLAPARYTVAWQAMAADDHRPEAPFIRGQFGFTVAAH